jgi:hypothetical protein
MKITYSALFGCFVTATLLMSSCLKDTIDNASEIKGVKGSPEMAAPLISASVGMAEIYKSFSADAGITERPDKLLVFVYQTKQDAPSEQFVAFPSLPFNYGIAMAAPIIAAFEFNGRLDISVEDSAKLPFANKERIKLVKVKKGNFTINLRNEYRHPVTLKIDYPTIQKNGVPISENIIIPAAPAVGQTSTINRVIDLEQYDFDFSRNGISYNVLPFKYEISIVRNPGSTTLTTDSFNISQVFQIEEYSQISGYLGKFEIFNRSEKIAIDLFNNAEQGQILINDPRITIRLYNSYGIPVTARLTNLRYQSVDNSTKPIVIDAFQDTFTFQQPLLPGQTAISEYKINNANSTIDDAVNDKPKFILFDVAFIANFREEIVDNFLVDTSRFQADFDAEVPFDIKMLDYRTITRGKNGLGGNALPDIVDRVTLDVKSDNGLPFDMYAQMLFVRDSITPTDTFDIVVDSLFDNELFIRGAAVDALGEVVQRTQGLQSVTLLKERYARVQTAPISIFRVRTETSQFNGAPGFVKIYTTQTMNLKVGGKLKLTYKTN